MRSLPSIKDLITPNLHPRAGRSVCGRQPVVPESRPTVHEIPAPRKTTRRAAGSRVIKPILRSLLMLLVCGLASCDKDRLYERSIELENKIWPADSALGFTFEITDLSQPYNFYFNVRNTLSYPYENLYITYFLKDTSNHVIKEKLVNFNLFDPKTGEPYGDGLGDIFDHRFLIIKNYKFTNIGSYVFEVRQYMRMDTLPEILSTGMRVEYTKVRK